MNSSTTPRPQMSELTPWAMFSAPREGPIVRSSTKYIGAASAPARRSNASSEASAGESSPVIRSEEHTSELQSRGHLVCRLLLEKKKNNKKLHSQATEDDH